MMRHLNFTGINLKTEYDFIRMECYDFTGKTTKWQVLNKNRGFPLGTIKWFSHWRCYCFYPAGSVDLVFSKSCMLDIINFIDQLMKDRKDGGK